MQPGYKFKAAKPSPIVLCLLVLISFAVFYSIPSSVLAQSGEFRVYPTRLMLDQQQFGSLNVTNTSSHSQRYRLEIIYLAFDERGALRPVDPDIAQTQGWALGPLMRFGPRQFVLGPGESQTIRIAARMNTAAEGEYRAHVHIRNMGTPTADSENTEESENQIGLSLNIRQNIAVPVFARKGDLGEPEITLLSSRYIKDDHTEKNGLELLFGFDSNRSVVGNLTVHRLSALQLNLKPDAAVSQIAMYPDSPLRRIFLPFEKSPEQQRVVIRYSGEENETEVIWLEQEIELHP
ncbi:MAG: hypothetical protein LAT67_04885 [Balneolales bacterium]|nr:hypothetical protein [Balneolales bacterium]